MTVPAVNAKITLTNTAHAVRAEPVTIATVTAKRTSRIEEIGDESRRRIMDAAEQLFVENGFERTSFVDIAERSGISRGSIPWHFQNKDGLLMAVAERSIRRHLPPELFAPDKANFREVIEEAFELMRPRGASLQFVLMTEALAAKGNLREQYIDFFQRRRQGLANWIWASRKDGKPATRADADAIGLAINGALIGLHMQWVIDPDGVDFEAGLDALSDMVEARLGLTGAKTRVAKARSTKRASA